MDKNIINAFPTLNVILSTGPFPLVVLSRVSSWKTTATPSEVNDTSNSMHLRRILG